jgi:hypothetical protein
MTATPYMLVHVSSAALPIPMPGEAYIAQHRGTLQRRFSAETGWTWQDAYRRGFRTVRVGSPAHRQLLATSHRHRRSLVGSPTLR